MSETSPTGTGGTRAATPLPAIVPYGDGALLVVLGNEVDTSMSRRVHALARVVRDATARESKWGAPVPGHASLLVPYDVRMLARNEATEQLGTMISNARDREATIGAARDNARGETPAEMSGGALEIPVRYGGDDGPDLDGVAATLGLAPADVVDLHASETYEVLLLGFAPGFAYLGMLSGRLALPRRATPRTRVPPGSVAIAGRQTAVYPSATPGGWHVIGRTDLAMWDVARDPPALLEPGRHVTFRPMAS